MRLSSSDFWLKALPNKKQNFRGVWPCIFSTLECRSHALSYFLESFCKCLIYCFSDMHLSNLKRRILPFSPMVPSAYWSLDSSYKPAMNIIASWSLRRPAVINLSQFVFCGFWILNKSSLDSYQVVKNLLCWTLDEGAANAEMSLLLSKEEFKLLLVDLPTSLLLPGLDRAEF